MIKAYLKKSFVGKAWNHYLSVKSSLVEKFVIPSYQEKRDILIFYMTKHNLEVFVETGTFLGDTIDFLKDKFKALYSIELSEDLAAKAAIRFKEFENVQIIQGDSGEKLAELVEHLTSPALFWLDGHYSSEFFLGNELIKTARSDKDTPIEKELICLLKSPVNHVILIDDARLFNGKGDYPKIKKLKQLVESFRKPYKLTVKRDIIRLVFQ